MECGHIETTWRNTSPYSPPNLKTKGQDGGTAIHSNGSIRANVVNYGTIAGGGGGSGSYGARYAGLSYGWQSGGWGGAPYGEGGWYVQNINASDGDTRKQSNSGLLVGNGVSHIYCGRFNFDITKDYDDLCPPRWNGKLYREQYGEYDYGFPNMHSNGKGGDIGIDGEFSINFKGRGFYNNDGGQAGFIYTGSNLTITNIRPGGFDLTRPDPTKPSTIAGKTFGRSQ
mgnify:CR=1 FL=1